MECCARGLKAAAKMIEDKALSGPLAARYAGWDKPENKAMLSGGSLESITERVLAQDINPQPKWASRKCWKISVNRYV